MPMQVVQASTHASSSVASRQWIGYSWQRNHIGADASIDDGGGSSSGSGSGIRAWGTYQTAVGPGKWTVMEFCGDYKNNKRLVTIREAFDELEKYLGASDHKSDLPNMLHLGSLPQTNGG